MSREAINASESAQLPAKQLDLLPGYSQACEMIERASRIDEAKAIRDKASALHAYAIKARNRDMEVLAAEIRMRAERKAGELLIERKKAGTLALKQNGRPKKVSAIDTLTSIGLTRDEAATWQRIAKLSESDFERRIARLRTNGDRHSLAAVFSTDSDEWMTPKEILDSVVSVLGEIDLDPCAERSDASANVEARFHFTEKHDGLAQPWEGAVFMNPPYSAADAFVEKLIASWKEGDVTQAIALLASRTDRAWFRALVAVAPVCFVAGRIIFNRADGKPVSKGGAPFPSAIFYLGPRVDRFAAEFNDFGPSLQSLQVRS
jgi:phage N-6-adenine-methyltransferase